MLIGLERYALAEESLADGLARLVNSTPKQDGSAADWEQAAASAQGSGAELIRAVAAHGLVLHTGGEASLAEPAALLHAAHALGLRAWAAAPGPLGRDRFGALLGDPSAEPPSPGSPAAPAAVTVAGLLTGAEGPGRDADGALDLDLLVVLDAPQLDVEAGALLAESLPDGARLVLAGDPAVLWSVGPGRVFADLLAARVCPQIASRRPDPGPLGELVSGIGVGELSQVEAPGKEVVIVPVRDAGEAVHRTVQLVADSVPRAIGVPAEETQVITPGHGGAVGTRALNAALKERLNPGPGRFGGFDPGDRVVHTPAPGRVLPGRVVGADADGLRLSCAGETVVVPRDRVEGSVRHGWALTAHQALGGRWPAVVVVLPGDAVPALSRPWIYTAFGRAARHLSVVHGVEQALPAPWQRSRPNRARPACRCFSHRRRRPPADQGPAPHVVRRPAVPGRAATPSAVRLQAGRFVVLVLVQIRVQIRVEVGVEVGVEVPVQLRQVGVAVLVVTVPVVLDVFDVLFVLDVVVELLVEDRADVESADHPLRVDLLERGLQPLAGVGALVRGRHPERGVPLLQPELLVPGGDLVRLELAEEETEGSVHRSRGLDVRRLLVRRLDPSGLGHQPLRLGHGVVAADQDAQRTGFLGARVRRQRVLPGDLEGSDLVVPVVEQFVVRLRGRGQLVERVVDGRVFFSRPAFDRGKVAVERGLDRLGGGAYLGSGGLRSIRHSADAIRTGPQPAQ